MFDQGNSREKTGTYILRIIPNNSFVMHYNIRDIPQEVSQCLLRE